jgi:hypothetical protein
MAAASASAVIAYRHTLAIPDVDALVLDVKNH